MASKKKVKDKVAEKVGDVINFIRGKKKEGEKNPAKFKGVRRDDGEQVIVEHKIPNLRPVVVCSACENVINAGKVPSVCPRCGAQGTEQQPAMTLRVYHDGLKCFVTSVEMTETMRKFRDEKGGLYFDHRVDSQGILPKAVCSRCNTPIEGAQSVDTYCPRCMATGKFIELRLWDMDRERFLTAWDGIPDVVKRE